MLIDRLNRLYVEAALFNKKQYSKLLADTTERLNSILISAAKHGEKEVTVTILAELVDDLMKHYNSQGFTTFAYSELVPGLKRLTIRGWDNDR